MSGFPLYDNLIKGLPKKDLIVKEKEAFISNIKKLDANGRDLIYALIIVYNQENKSAETGIPYRGVKEEKSKGVYNFSWVFTQFPVKLRRLLHRFVEIHLKNQEEEAERKDQRL